MISVFLETILSCVNSFENHLKEKFEGKEYLKDNEKNIYRLFHEDAKPACQLRLGDDFDDELKYEDIEVAREVFNRFFTLSKYIRKILITRRATNCN